MPNQKALLFDLKRHIYGFIKKNFYLIISLAVCLPIYFVNAMKHSVPMGYAGLFTQMAKQIADANFSMPVETPFYGPGGVPFVYPPLGLYLFAILIKLTGKYFIFLRILPPLLGLVSFIPLYYVTLEVSKSRLAAMSAVIIARSSLDIYINNAWAAGIVRAPAFIFCLLAIYFSLRLYNTHSWSDRVLGGVFLGLTLMSHLVYALFCFLWFWWWSVWNRDILNRVRVALTVSVIGFLVASLWLVPVLYVYGVEMFILAFGSHGGDSLFSFWLEPASLLKIFLDRILPISSELSLVILVSIGTLYLLVKKNFVLPLFFLLIIFGFPVSESDRFVFLVGSVIAGIGLSVVANIISGLTVERWRPILVIMVMVPILGFLSWKSYVAVSRQHPRFYSSTLELADFIQSNMPPGQKYLALIQQDEAEWLPFLFQREPVVGKWGGEWLGKYVQQMHFVGLFRGCQLEQDWSCVKSTFDVASVNPSYIISYSHDRILYNAIQLDMQWQKVYEDDRYVVWERVY